MRCQDNDDDDDDNYKNINIVEHLNGGSSKILS